MGIRNLEGAVVAITGGGRGIGLAVAEAMAACGARVSIGDVDSALATRAAARLGGFGGWLDVRERQAFARWLADTEAALGPVDVLVNNAGIMPAGAFVQEPDGLSDAQIDINVRGVIHGCKAVLPGMLARGRGQVVNIASMAGRLAVPGLAVYCATKFAVVGLTETLREEYRDSGVGFSMILPAKVTTELAAGTDKAGRGVPTASPEDVAAAVIAAVRTDAAELMVPGYLGSVPALQGFAPRWLLRGLRRTLGDRRILEQLDWDARTGYAERIASLVVASGRSSDGQTAARAGKSVSASGGKE